MRIATPEEVAEHLRTASEQYRAAVENQDGTWYVCSRCGPESVVMWQTFELDLDPPS
jgi:hypothetical protein